MNSHRVILLGSGNNGKTSLLNKWKSQHISATLPSDDYCVGLIISYPDVPLRLDCQEVNHIPD